MIIICNSSASSSKPWIIERLDRKLAYAIGFTIVEKCDVTLSRVIQPLTSDVLASYFSSPISSIYISVLDYTYCPCFKVKDEEDLLLEKNL